MVLRIMDVALANRIDELVHVARADRAVGRRGTRTVGNQVVGYAEAVRGYALAGAWAEVAESLTALALVDPLPERGAAPTSALQRAVVAVVKCRAFAATGPGRELAQRVEQGQIEGASQDGAPVGEGDG